VERIRRSLHPNVPGRAEPCAHGAMRHCDLVEMVVEWIDPDSLTLCLPGCIIANLCGFANKQFLWGVAKPAEQYN
jgi:hypothetical protein